MEYDYRVVELPMGLAGARKGGGEAARALAKSIDENATEGFEFYRVDTFSVTRPGGCLGPQGGETESYNVVTFRRPRDKPS